MVLTSKLHKLFQDYPLILSLFICAVLYTFTVCPTIFVGDIPELSASIYSAGIGHPPGYPLYILLGFIITRPLHSVFGGDFAHYTNLYSSLWTILSLWIFYRLVQTILKKIYIKKDFFFNIVPALSTVMLGTSKTLWEQSLITEVYTLQFFLMILLIYICFKLFSELKQVQNTKVKYKKKLFFFNHNKKYLLLAGLLFGLGFTHHLTFILVFPSILLLLYIFSRKTFYVKTAVFFILGFLLGIAPVIYLPVRASTNPYMNWGKPDTPKLLYEHFTGKLYQKKLMKLPLKKIIANMGKYFINLVNQSGILVLLISLAGIKTFLRNYRYFLFFLVSLSFFVIIYTANYNIPDIEAYYLPSYILVYILFIFGLVQLTEFRNFKHSKIIIISGTMLLILYNSFFNYISNDISDCYQLKNYIDNIILSVPEKGIFVVSGDDVIGSFSYMQVVEGKKKDVIPIASNFDPYPWYYENLRERYPRLDVPEYKNSYRNEMSKRVLDRNMKKFEVTSLYSTENVTRFYKYIPQGITGKLFFKNEKVDEKNMVIPEYWKKYIVKGFDNYTYGKPLKNHTAVRLNSLLVNYANSLCNLAAFYLNTGKYDKIEPVLEFLEKIDPNYPQIFYIRGSKYYNTRDYKKALINFKKCKKINPSFQGIDKFINKCSYWIQAADKFN